MVFLFRHGYTPFPRQWLILTVCLAVLGLAIGGNLVLERGRVESRERERLLSQTDVVRQITEQNLMALDAVMKDLIECCARGESDASLNHRLTVLTDALTAVRTLVVIDGEGFVRASNRPELVGGNFSQREYFTTARDNPDPATLYVSTPFHTALGIWTMTLQRIIPGPGGGFAGVVTASLDPSFFAPLLGAVLYAPDMWANLVHGDGTVFLAMPGREGMTGRNLAVPGAFFTLHRDSGQETSVFTGVVRVTGENRMLAVRNIRPPGLSMSAPLVIGISRDLDAMYAPWRRQALMQGSLFAAAALSAVLFLYVLQKRQKAHAREMAQASRALAERERFIRTVTDAIPGMVGYWDRELRCRYGNHAYLEWFGKTQEEMIGISIQELMGEALFAKNEPHIRAALDGQAQTFERTLSKTDGSTGYTLARYIPDLVDGEVKGFFVLVTDVTALKMAQLELERRVNELDVLASTDYLTGIANRRHFLDRAKEELARSGRYGHPLAFLMLDVDHFKAINDTHGHDAGDEVLRGLAALLKDAVRITDIVGRLGGEEFAALLVETGEEEARAVAERLRQAARSVCLRGRGGALCYTVSIGLAGYAGGDTVEDLMKRADQALYRAKGTGRDKVCVNGDE